MDCSLAQLPPESGIQVSASRCALPSSPLGTQGDASATASVPAALPRDPRDPLAQVRGPSPSGACGGAGAAPPGCAAPPERQALRPGGVLGNRKRVIRREWWSRARQEEARIRSIFAPAPSQSREAAAPAARADRALPRPQAGSGRETPAGRLRGGEAGVLPPRPKVSRGRIGPSGTTGPWSRWTYPSHGSQRPLRRRGGAWRGQF